MAIRQQNHPRIKPPTRPKWQSKYHGVRMTPEQYLALPEEKPYLELIDGVVEQKPMVNADHGRVALGGGADLAGLSLADVLAHSAEAQGCLCLYDRLRQTLGLRVWHP